MNFKIITAVFNAATYFERYAFSIAHQDHDNYEVIIIDDASTDGTRNLVAEACEQYGWTCLLNTTHQGALYNQVHGIRALDCQPDDVLVFVDGDDRLAHREALSHLEYHYRDGAQLTYGQYDTDPYSSTCTPASPYPAEMIAERNFRQVAANGGGIFWNHLRTFKHKIFAQMTDEDFKDKKGGWYQTATDAALMYPALELAAPDIKFIDEVLYTYSSDNAISDWRKWPRQCDRDHMHVLRKKPKR